MTSLLLTYFGAFSGTPYNPTEAVARRAAAALLESAPGLTVHVKELPVEFAGSSKALSEALEEYEPDVAISLGVAVGREKVSLERVAINLDAARIADNAGAQLTDTPIRLDGPDAYFSALPTRAIFEELDAAGLPVELSYTAGTFVCNHVFYELRHATGGLIPAGFIHIPMSRPDTPASLAPGETASLQDAGSGLRAHAETGGVEGTDVPTVPEGQLALILERAVLLSLGHLPREKASF